MGQNVLDQILEDLSTLEPDALREVERTVRELLEPSSLASEREAALRVLQHAGVVKEIKRPSMAQRPRRPPISVQGKPLSETIVEERR